MSPGLLARRRFRPGVHSAGPPAFSPASIAGLEQWWKADAITGMADGDPVSSWAASGGAAALVQATGGKQPLYKTGIQNGLPAVQFDGVDDFLSATVTARATATVLMVARMTSTSGDRQMFWSGEHEMFDINVGGYGLGIYEGAFVGGAYTAPLAASVLTGVFSGGGGSQFRRNGSATTGSAGAGLASTTLVVASNSGTSRFMGGYLGEILRYNGALAGADITALESYLKAKWATP